MSIGHFSGQQLPSFIIISLSNTWTFIEDLDQGHVDAVSAVKWPEPMSVGFIVRQADYRTTSLLFEDPTISNNNGLLRRFSISCSGNELLTGEALVRNDNVGT